MKNIVLGLIVILITSSLVASTKQYDKALQLYNDKKYKEAQEIFKELILINNTKRINFYLGRTSYELGNYEQALDYFQNVLKEDPNNLRVKLEIAQSYAKLGKKKEAKVEFEYLLTQKIPANIKEYITKALKALETDKKYTLTNTLIVGFGYDDNIESTTNSSGYSIYVPSLNTNLPITSNKKISSGSYEMGLVSNYVRKIDEEFILDTNFVAFSQNYFSNSLHSKEVQVVSLSIAPVFLTKSFKTSIKFGYDHIWYGHQSYLDNYTLAPELNYKINENYLYTSTLSHTRKAYIQTSNKYGDPTATGINDKEKDSRVYEWKNKLSHYTKTTGLSKLELALGKESDLDDVRYDVDKRYAALELGNIYPMTDKINLSSALNFTKTKYDTYDRNFLKYRSDDTYRLSLGLSYVLKKSLTLNSAYTHTKQSSNFEPYDYDKNIVKVNLYYTF